MHTYTCAHSQYKFTNVKREHDRTTLWMRRHFTGPNVTKDTDPGLVLFNCALFRYFGSIKYAERMGWVGNRDQGYDQG